MNDEQQRSDKLTWVAGLAVGVIVLSLLVAAYEIGLNRGRGDSGGGAPAVTDSSGAEQPAPDARDEKRPEPEQAAGPGRDLFVQSCGSCHVLSAAGTAGSIGPNLDQLNADAKRVLAAIENGGTGSGAMPVNIVTGKDARDVADFVASAATP